MFFFNCLKLGCGKWKTSHEMSKGIYVIAFARFLHCQIFRTEHILKVYTSGLCYCFGFHRGNTNKFDEQADGNSLKLRDKYFSVRHIFKKIHVQGRIAPVHTMRP
jgi:hypothetical protein